MVPHIAGEVAGAEHNRVHPLIAQHLRRLLDAGALGICLAHAETPEQVAELVRWMKYPPVGERALFMGANAGMALQ